MRSIELLLSQERVVSLLYAKTFPIVKNVSITNAFQKQPKFSQSKDAVEEDIDVDNSLDIDAMLGVPVVDTDDMISGASSRPRTADQQTDFMIGEGDQHKLPPITK